MPKVWIDLEQTYKGYNQPFWAGVGIWRCEEVWCGWRKGRSLSLALLIFPKYLEGFQAHQLIMHLWLDLVSRIAGVVIGARD